MSLGNPANVYCYKTRSPVIQFKLHPLLTCLTMRRHELFMSNTCLYLSDFCRELPQGVLKSCAKVYFMDARAIKAALP